MAEKTIRVEEGIHERLEQKKAEMGVETFNQVLERMLGVTPDATVDELGAYLSDEARENAREMVEAAADIGDLEPRVDDRNYNDILELVSGETGLVIALFEFSETVMWAKYRNQSDGFAPCGILQDSSNNGVLLGTGSKTHDGVEFDDVLENLEKKVSGAWRRWGTN